MDRTLPDERTWAERLAAAERLTAPGGPFETRPTVVRGVTMRDYVRRPTGVVDALARAFERHGDAEALVGHDRRLTFAQLRDETLAVAAGLREVGVGPGDRVAIVGANSVEWVIAFLAAVHAGAVAVPLNAWWQGEELAYAIADADPAVVFADDTRLERLAGHTSARPIYGLGAPGPAGHLRDLRRDGASTGVTPADDDLFAIFYTSGTTGRPKGVMLDHRGVAVNLRNLVYFTVRSRVIAGEGRPGGPRRQNVALVAVPLFHVTGCQATLVVSLAFGNKVVLYPPTRFDPETAMSVIAREGVTHLSAVPTMMRRILDAPGFRPERLRSLRAVAYGGAPVPPTLAAATAERLPWLRSLGNGYGLTETNSAIIGNYGLEYLRKPHAIGKPAPVVEVRLLDADGDDVPDGVPGELTVRGPMLFAGYWRDPDATAAALDEGWFRTGDVALRDEEGDLILVDRAKDVIIRGGENVASVEVENVLAAHPAVAEVAVVGVPDPDLGERVKAVVVPKAPVGAEELRAWAADRLAHFKVPEIVELRGEPLPRNPAGKVLKGILRAERSPSTEEGPTHDR